MLDRILSAAHQMARGTMLGSGILLVGALVSVVLIVGVFVLGMLGLCLCSIGMLNLAEMGWFAHTAAQLLVRHVP